MGEELSNLYEEMTLTQPLFTRIYHWVQFITLSILSFSGLYINAPGWLNVKMKSITLWHLIAAYILVANFCGYVYYYSVTKYYHNVIFKFRDIKYLFGFFKYVFFFKDELPYYGKYNPGQKIVFTLWYLLIIFMTITGFVLYYPAQLQFMRIFLGELSNIRLLHYLGAIGFITTIPLHLYLVFTEDPAKLQAMFSGYIKK